MAVLQALPSLRPDQPPNETDTSPPAARMAAMAVASVPPSSGRAPSHSGVQPWPASMKARVKSRMPVAAITVVGSGGFPQPR